MKVELNFDVPRDKKIIIKLNKAQTKKVIKWLDEGNDCHVFFPDYEA